MDRPDRDLVDPRALNGHEWKASHRIEGRRVTGVATHRMPILRPMRVAHQPSWLRMPHWRNPVQVHHFPLEAARRDGQLRQRRHRRIRRAGAQRQLDSPIRLSRHQQVDHPQCVAIVVRRDQRKPVALGQ